VAAAERRSAMLGRAMECSTFTQLSNIVIDRNLPRHSHKKTRILRVSLSAG
jgi:hypothetical protein